MVAPGESATAATTAEAAAGASVRLLYIMGNGRSGSTVLDTVLGNHESVESVGELIKLPTEAWINNEFCACGERADTCSFWAAVRRDWTRRTGGATVDDFLAAERELMEGARRRRGRPYMGFHPPDVESAAFRAFADGTMALLEAIRSVSRKPIVVDSSKNAVRAFLLHHVVGSDLRVVHLVRDPRGFVWSHKKSFEADAAKGVQRQLEQRAAWRSLTKWTRTNLQSDWVRRQLPAEHSVRILYEDFVTQPEVSIREIGRLMGVKLTDVLAMVRDGRPLAVGHTIAGNRLRMAGSVRLRLDEEWRRRLSPTDRWLSWGVAGWLAGRYGYRRR